METVDTKTPVELATLKKCAHPACICTVEQGETFCSDSCAARLEDAAEADTCDCGHPECTNAARAPTIPGGAVIS
jgi:hypothetical protein